MIEITAKELKKIVHDNVSSGGWFSRLHIELRDRKYRLYSIKAIRLHQEYIKQPHRHKYEADFWDCDDIADYLILMMKIVLPGCAAFYIKAKNNIQSHAFVGIVTEQKKILYLEGSIARYPKILKIRF